MSASPLAIHTVEQLRIFMQHHVFAVWDFMLLLKALQHEIAPSGTPWLPPRYACSAGLVHQLVAEEECDCLPSTLGGPRHLSHFEIYLLAMDEVKADTAPIQSVLQAAANTGLSACLRDPTVPEPSQRFMASTHEVINSRKPHLLATAYCYGREQLVPALFQQILEQINRSELNTPLFKWYLKRHIELDGESHGPLAEQMVIELCEGKTEYIRESQTLRRQIEDERMIFWSSIARRLNSVRATAQARAD